MRYGLCFLLFLFVSAGWSDTLDPGGVSIDFSGIRPDSGKAQGENLIRDGDFEGSGISLKDLKSLSAGQWGGSFYVHSREKAEQDLKADFAALAVRRVVTAHPASGRQCVMLESPLSMRKLQNDKGGPQMSNRIARWVALEPRNHPVKYRLSMKLRGRLENVPGSNGFSVFVECRDNRKIWKSGKLAPAVQQRLTVPSEWTERALEFIAPPGTEMLTFSLALYGLGRVWIDDVALVPVESARGVTGKLFPADPCCSY